MHVLQLSLHGTAVTTQGWTASWDNGPISQDGSPSPKRGLDLLHVLQLVLNGTAVTTQEWTAPCDDRSISQNGSKSPRTGLDVLNVLQLILHRTALTTNEFIAPCDDRPISQDGRKTCSATTYANGAYLQQSPVCNLASPSVESPSRTLPHELKSRPRPTPSSVRARSAKLCTEAVRSASSDALLATDQGHIHVNCHGNKTECGVKVPKSSLSPSYATGKPRTLQH